MFNLNGKVALVTGASRGIGQGIALMLAKAGADVVVNCHSQEERAQVCAASIQGLGRRAFVFRADVSNKKEVGAMVEAVIKEFGKIDILVNNAGILDYGAFLEMSEEQWDKTLAVNLKGQFLVAQAAAKIMAAKKTKGRIINIASIASGQVGVGFANIAHYCASKGGVVAMTETMALELGPLGINVNAIAPGAIDTDMTKSIKDNPEMLKGIMARIPKGRLGKPEEIGAMAVFLASDEADYCTGATFYVDGGWLAG